MSLPSPNRRYSMKVLLFALLTLGPLGFLVKDMPSEAELTQDTVVPYARPIIIEPAGTTTSTSDPVTSTTADAPEVRLTIPSTTDTSVADGAKCPEWWATAAAMGWPAELLPTLDEVMWRESRCQADATNGADHGLVQVNWATWQHLVKSLGHDKQALYVPAVNLFIGRLIYLAAVNSDYRCPWSPWSASGNYCK